MVSTSSESVCNFIYPPFILVDPCPPILTKTVVRTVATIAGIALAPCGILGKIVGGVIVEKSEYAVTPFKLNEMPKINEISHFAHIDYQAFAINDCAACF